MMSHKSDIVVVLNHLSDAFVVDNILKMAQQIGPERFYVCYDNTNNSLDMSKFIGFKHIDMCQDEKVEDGPAVCVFNNALAQSINRLHQRNRDQYEAPICLMAATITRVFDYMWFVENDIYCHGDWSAALALAGDMPHDFLATCTGRYDGSNWDKWPRLLWPNKPLQTRVKCFVPCARYSRAMIECMRTHLGIMSGYIEVYLSTLCDHFGLTWGDLPSDMFSEHWTYVPKYPSYWRDVCSSTPVNNRLYHPIKP